MSCREHRVLALSGLAFIGAGSNVGNREELLRTAAQRIAATKGVLNLICSPVYETLPVGLAGPDRFLNAVFQVNVRLSPMALLERMQLIEAELGRRPPRSGPRPIDLDLLFYDDLVMRTESLVLPHPRAHLRSFVLMPLADLAPAFCHPELGLSVRDLLEGLSGPSEILGRVGAEYTLEHADTSH
jgi:2-amino-4-hydroxy-6-hydroxymethyldihydropteridine diphosphokinase